MVEHLMNVTVAFVLLVLPIFNTIQLYKIHKILSEN